MEPTPVPAAARITHVTYARRPRAWRYMLGALRSGRRSQPAGPLPDVRASWHGYRPSPGELAAFARLCGLPPAGERMPSLFLHAIAFRLQMVVLTHPSMPVPIWRLLQVRNQLLDLEPVARDAVLDIECRTHAQRVLPKGIEFDVHTTVTVAGRPVAQSVNTFYAKGHFGPAAEAPPPSAPSTPDTHPVASWRMKGGGGVRFGRHTGDYNGKHLWRGYARVMGFRKAFFHPLRVVAHSLGRIGLHDAAQPRRLDIWLKGPVFHDAEVQLRVGEEADATVLSVLTDGDPRPAIVARCSPI